MDGNSNVKPKTEILTNFVFFILYLFFFFLLCIIHLMEMTIKEMNWMKLAKQEAQLGTCQWGLKMMN